MSKPISLVTALSLLAPAALAAQTPPAASHTTHPKAATAQAPAAHAAAARGDTGGKAMAKHAPNTPKTESLKARIRSAQEALANRGLYHGKADGRNGRAFRAALRKFQRENQLPVTGRLTKETLEKLRA